MDGKNVFDFVDPEILSKLEKIEAEEDEIRNQMDEDNNNSDESSELSEDLLEAHDDVLHNKEAIKRKHKMVRGSVLPRKVRDLTATEKFMADLRTDKEKEISEGKMLSMKMRRETKDRLKKNLLNEVEKDQEEMEEDDLEDIMDVEGEDDENAKRFKKAKLSEEQKAALKRKEKIEQQKQDVVERLQRKIQKGWNRQSRVNDADRQIGSKMPKHLNSGKRGIGKTDRR